MLFRSIICPIANIFHKSDGRIVEGDVDPAFFGIGQIQGLFLKIANCLFQINSDRRERIFIILCGKCQSEENNYYRPDGLNGFNGPSEGSTRLNSRTDPLIINRIGEWQDLKFGFMMHWGIYAQWGHLRPVGRGGELEHLQRIVDYTREAG